MIREPWQHAGLGVEGLDVSRRMGWVMAFGVVYNLPEDVTSLPEGVSPTETTEQGASQGTNDFGRVGYGGPCPPPGKPHRYFFRLYALDQKIDPPPRATKTDLLSAMGGHILDKTELMGKYGR